ncbi:MAG: hypothetical protein LUE89_06335 [Clostridiales bacterium]|nr:hypothetical protein [Clostridiales bacterium]
METTKEARSSAATPERTENGGMRGDTFPKEDFNTLAGGIASLLLTGPENALTLRDLERLTGENGRAIRRQIERERRRGIPILSSTSEGIAGYFLPANELDTRRFVGSMRGRAREILRTARAVEQGGANPDQLSFDEMDTGGEG